MKRFRLFILLPIFSLAARAAEPLAGYVVMENSDTIKCKIKSGRFLANPYYGITIINEQGEEQTFKGKDKKIIAFGFEENLRRYDYLFVDVGDKSENGFYQRLVNGSKYKLYSQPPTIYGGNPTYVLYNQKGEFVKFEPCLVCPWRKQLREFLKDDAKAVELVEDAPRVNIPKFVLDINKV